MPITWFFPVVLMGILKQQRRWHLHYTSLQEPVVTSHIRLQNLNE